ncbi:MAG: SGNH/GDSL hydrolase family protein [Candidatus Omnitrophota bacterium]
MLIKKALSSLFLLFFLLLFFEIISYNIVIPDKRLNILDSTKTIIEEDPVLIWKQRAHLKKMFQGAEVITNSAGFRNREFSIEKNNSTYRIICLGASDTFGWGVDFSKTYPFLLEQKLNKTGRIKNVEVINAGEIGYTTHQGLILFKNYLLKYKPDLITIAYILNDIDRYRFYRNCALTDSELTRRNSLVVRLNNVFSKSRGYLVLEKLFSFILRKNERFKSYLLKKEFSLARQRVSRDEYRRNLEEFINVCIKHKIKIMFIKMPINLSLPSLTEFEKNILSNNGNLSVFYYNLANNYENKKEYHSSALFFKKARDYLVLDCRQDGISLQNTIEKVSLKNNISLLDVNAIFLGFKSYESLFNSPNDPMHPNKSGHEIIADAACSLILNSNSFN